MRLSIHDSRRVVGTIVVALILAACAGAVSPGPAGTATGGTSLPGSSVAPGGQPDWDAVLAEARGQTVYWFMWGGSDQINSYVSDWVGAKAAELGVTIKRIPITDTVDAVNKVLGEKSAGRDTDGSVDLIWINGENFRSGKQANLWACGWVDALPNSALVDFGDPAIANDFGTPVDGCESPWSRAQFAFVYDSSKITTPPDSMAALIAWIQANPGRFTYSAPPDFTGSVFVRQVFYMEAGGYQDLLGPFDQSKYDSVAAKTWQTLNNIEPSLWRQGETYPESKESLDRLYSNGEIWMTMTYIPADAGSQVRKGIYPPSTREFVLKEGTIGNSNYVAIPYNSPHKAGAMVVANILLSAEAQYQKALPEVWGEFPAIDIARTGEWALKFGSIPVPASVLPYEVLSVNSNPELQGDWVVAIEQGWTANVLQK